jgi:ABC-type phosphate/phosphonate transport system permease subunit
MKMRYFIGAIFGYKFAAKLAILGTKNIHKARTAIPARKIITFKKVVEPLLTFTLSTSLI